jgi:hypothetical protein
MPLQLWRAGHRVQLMEHFNTSQDPLDPVGCNSYRLGVLCHGSHLISSFVTRLTAKTRCAVFHLQDRTDTSIALNF